VQTVPSGDLARLSAVVAAARGRYALPAMAPVRSCYEAGRDGFWIHRAVTALGWSNRVVDSSSIEVNRRARRTKTDRIDACKLVTMLVRVWAGEAGVWCEVRVPSAAVEAARLVSRERTALVAARTQVRNQVESWLATVGCRSARRARTGEWWTTACDGQGAPLSAPLQARLARATAHLAVLGAQIATLEAQQAAAVAAAPRESTLGRLVHLKGVATTSASTLVAEGLIWREFQNRRQLGGLLGFAPAPYQSGTLARDQGISRAGNARLQAVCIQLAWNWVRWQPASPLTQWYRARFGTGRRARRIGIVAVARKLLIVLWRYATTGVRPAGAIVKSA
jgi:transposase